MKKMSLKIKIPKTEKNPFECKIMMIRNKMLNKKRTLVRTERKVSNQMITTQKTWQAK